MKPAGADPLPWSVYVDDNYRFMDDSKRVLHGKFATYAEAVRACMAIVEGSVEGTGSGCLSFGGDPFVLPAVSDEEIAAVLEENPDWPREAFSGGYFSARTYAITLYQTSNA